MELEGPVRLLRVKSLIEEDAKGTGEPPKEDPKISTPEISTEEKTKATTQEIVTEPGTSSKQIVSMDPGTSTHKELAASGNPLHSPQEISSDEHPFSIQESPPQEDPAFLSTEFPTSGDLLMRPRSTLAAFRIALSNFRIRRRPQPSNAEEIVLKPLAASRVIREEQTAPNSRHWLRNYLSSSLRRRFYATSDTSARDAQPPEDIPQEGQDNPVALQVINPGRLSIISNQSAPEAPHQHGRFLACCLYIKDLFVNLPVVFLMHWLLGLLTIVMFLLALVFHWWRVIRVDRQSLLLSSNTEQMRILLRNFTITMTRSQVVFWECLVDATGNYVNYYNTNLQIDYLNGTSFVRPACHRILDGIHATYPPERMQTNISGSVHVMMVAGPIALSIAVITMIIQVLTERSNWRSVFLVFNCGMRIFNTILCIFVISSSVLLDDYFRAKNPNFPISWPKEVRNATEVETWKAGPIDWILGMVFQFGAICLDMRRFRVLQTLN